MSRDENAIAYAEEVYAACATVGFESASVAALKALLDAPNVSDSSLLVEAAKKAQRESIAWVAR